MERNLLKYHCANSNCKMVLFPLKATDYDGTPPGIGDFLVCGACSTISVVTLGTTRLFTKGDKKSLSKEELKDMEFALRASVKKIKLN